MGSQNDTFLIVSVCTVIAAIVFAAVRAVRVENATVWGMLTKKFGIDPERYDDSNGPGSILGEMKLLDVGFVGHVSVVDAGILFRFDYLTRHELLLYEWKNIQSYRVDKRDPRRLVMRFSRSSGLDCEVDFPWSLELSKSLPRNPGP